MKKTVYIIGQTVGLSKLGLENFNAVEGFLDKQGYESVKPHDLFDDFDPNILTQKEHLVRRVSAMLECDLVLLVPGWSNDSYARAEHADARRNEKHIVRYEQWRQVMKTKTNNAFIPFQTKYGVTRISQVA